MKWTYNGSFTRLTANPKEATGFEPVIAVRLTSVFKTDALPVRLRFHYEEVFIVDPPQLLAMPDNCGIF